jgi:hypothetical protein
MAVEEFTLLQKSGRTIYYMLWRSSDGLVWDSFDGTFKTIGLATAPYLSTVERATDAGFGFSQYVASINLSNVNDNGAADFFLQAFSQLGGSPDQTTDKVSGYIGVCIENGRTKLTEAAIENLLEQTGGGSIPVDQDFPTENALCYIKNGIPVDNAEIKAYLKSDYCAGRRSNEYVKGASVTTVTGDWLTPIMLDPAEYIIQFFKQGECGPDTACITVE